MAACEVAWLRKLLGDLGLHVDRHVVIYCDNFSSIQLARNPMFHARTKHIEVHYHFIRKKVLAGEIDLIYVSIEDQVVDISTKVLEVDKHCRFRNMFGVMELELSLRGSVEISSSTRADAPLSSLLDPLEGLSMLNCRKLELEGHSQLPALKGVRGACWKSRD